jgi:hypothetical protein
LKIQFAPLMPVWCISSASLLSASSSTNPTKPQENQQMLGPDGPPRRHAMAPVACPSVTAMFFDPASAHLPMVWGVKFAIVYQFYQVVGKLLPSGKLT